MICHITPQRISSFLQSKNIKLQVQQQEHQIVNIEITWITEEITSNTRFTEHIASPNKRKCLQHLAVGS